MADKFPHPFKKVAAKYRKFRRDLTADVSNIAETEFTQNFGRNKVGGYRDNGVFHRWAKRKNIPGKRPSARSVLVKSGRLRRSFQKRPDFNTARVVNTAPYAKIHNEGGEIKGTVKVRQFTRRNGSKVKSHTRKVNTTMPKRPFMVSNSNIIQAVDAHIDNQLNRIFNDSI